MGAASKNLKSTKAPQQKTPNMSLDVWRESPAPPPHNETQVLFLGPFFGASRGIFFILFLLFYFWFFITNLAQKMIIFLGHK